MLFAATHTSMQTLTIIIVTLNEASHIYRLKASIENLIVPADLAIETILVDGGSRDGTVQVAKEHGFTKTIILPDTNIPVCRNAGIKEARGDWLAFVDGDCELTKEWLLAALPLMKSANAVILGWPAAPPQPRTWVQENWWFHWCNKNNALAIEINGVHCIKQDAFRLITTRNLLINRNAYDLVHGFNEELPTGEDTDLVFRATLAKATVLAIPRMTVYHYGDPATLSAFFKQQLWHANRRSYRQISAQCGKKIGANAPRFTYLFLCSVLIAIFSIVMATVKSLICLIGLLPLLATIVLPALRVCSKGGTFQPFLPLCALYATYGLARSIDLIGLHKKKYSWK